MRTLTFAGDESGDVSFSFGKGASRYFALAMIATDEPDALRQTLTDIRQRSGLKRSFEFRFHDLTSLRLRQRVFEALQAMDFDAWGLIVDKPALPDVFRVMNGMEFYLYFVSELIRALPEELRQDATLILDEYGSARSLRNGLRRTLKSRGIAHRFRRILIRRSHSEPLIQIADLVAGAIQRRDASKGNQAYTYIQGKVKSLIEYSP